MDLSALKVKRRTLKASCTRIKIYVDAIGEITNNEIEQLYVCKDKLESFWHEFDAVQTQINLLEQNPEYDKRENFETAYFDFRARMQRMLDIINAVQHSQFNPAAFNVNASQQTPSNSHIRPPKLNLPVFFGNYQEWTLFSQMF